MEIFTLGLNPCSHSKLDEFGEYLYTVLESAARANRTRRSIELEHLCEKTSICCGIIPTKREETGRQYLRRKGCMTRRAKKHRRGI